MDQQPTRRTRQSPASPAQVASVRGLLRSRSVPDDLRRRALAPTLTDGDCRDIIPLLEDLPRASEFEDWSTPEGYDDSPDQGVHRFDGGGAW